MEGMGGNAELRMQNLELRMKRIRHEDAKSGKGRIRMKNGEEGWGRFGNEWLRVTLETRVRERFVH
jgi:hypothetical protein